MKIIAWVGYSNSGKTRLIQRVLLELKNRGYSVAVIKSCHREFMLSPEGKDSSRFLDAGAKGVAIVSPEKFVILEKERENKELKALAFEFFHSVDFVLIEGGHSDPSIEKIAVLKKGKPVKALNFPEEYIAFVSEEDLDVNKPVFHPDDIAQITDFIT